MSNRLNTVIRTLQRGKQIGGNFGVELAIASRAVLDKNNNVAYDPDNLPSSLSNLLASAGGGSAVKAAGNIVTNYVPVTTNSQSFNALGLDEVVYLTPAGTIAADTIVFPTDATSRIGQILTLTSTQIVSTLTVTSAGLTLLGTAVTSLAVNTPRTWQKVAASTWLRLL